MSETAKYRHLTTAYCVGNGIDIGSGGDPVVPWAIQVELSSSDYNRYNHTTVPLTLQWRGDASNLPFKDNTLDFVYSSHLLEDFLYWEPLLKEWVRVLKPGGALVILIPDKARWLAALQTGQPPNNAHQHEGYVGELSSYAPALNLQVIVDQLTNLSSRDYSILFVARKQ